MKKYDVIIIGSGPAGYTAAIYSSRANLKTLVIEGIERGGQLMITSEVENYPGFPSGIDGPEMMEQFREQSKRFGAVLLEELATEVSLEQNPFRVNIEDDIYTSDAVIIATGASARFLDIPSEKEFKGKGVSACATCDGFFFKDKNVIVVGGGDTAMEEAVFLTKFANEVHIVHRSDKFRASKIMLERAKNHPKITIHTYREINEIYGDKESGIVSGVKLKNNIDGSISDFPIQGVFIAIGHVPNTQLFENILEMDKTKYIITKPDKTATNIPGVFAAGDVQDSYYRQAITAAGTGCMAAIEAERYLEEKKSVSS